MPSSRVKVTSVTLSALFITSPKSLTYHQITKEISHKERKKKKVLGLALGVSEQDPGNNYVAGFDAIDDKVGLVIVGVVRLADLLHRERDHALDSAALLKRKIGKENENETLDYRS